MPEDTKPSTSDRQSRPPASADIASLKRQIVDLSALADASRRLGLISQSDKLYQVLYDLLVCHFKVQELALFLYHESRSRFQRVFNRGFKELRSEFGGGHPDIRKLLTGVDFLSAQSIRENPQLRQYFDDEALDRSRPGLWIPLVMQQHLLGLMAVDIGAADLDRRPQGRFFLSHITRQAAVCINTCQLYAARRKEKENLNKTIYNLSLLYDIGRAMTYISDLKSLLKYILTQAIELTGAEKGSIMLYDPDTNLLSIRVLAGLADIGYQEKVNNNEIQCKSFMPGEGVAGKVFASGKPIILNHTGDDQAFIAAAASYVHSIACIPMRVYHNIIGVINVTNKQNRRGFSTEDVEMLSAVADQAAVSISKAQLWEMAVKDSLTGLHVRRYFMAKLQDEINRTERYQNTLSLIMADLDHFKLVNDRFGHTTGDLVLKTIGRFLQKGIRDVDTIGRYGGEEFVIYLPETDKACACTLARRLNTGVSELKISRLPRQTISMGVAAYPEDGRSMRQLIQKADAALYAAKTGGRNKVVAYSGDIVLPDGN